MKQTGCHLETLRSGRREGPGRRSWLPRVRRLAPWLPAVVLLASSAAGCNRQTPPRNHDTSAAQPPAGAPLFEPPVLASHAGRLTVDLDAAPGSFAIGGEQFTGMLYDGAYIPPVWRVARATS
jgi:hypothetical protein